jgi:hypothetical protein
MPAFTSVDRQGITQILAYECRNLAAVASTNIWMHFRRRLLAHVRRALAISDAEFDSLSKDQRRARRLRCSGSKSNQQKPKRLSKRVETV